MKRLLRTTLFIAVSVLVVCILKQAFPKNTGALNLFLVLLLSDTLLWYATQKELRSLKASMRILFTILFWLPFCLVITGVLYGFFRTFYTWPLFVRTYLISFIFIAYSSRIIPLFFLLVILALKGTFLSLAGLAPNLRQWPGKARHVFRAGWWTGLFAFLLMLAGMVFWEHHFKVRTTEIASDRLPPAFDGLRIVQISDIHLGSWNPRSKLEELVRLVNSLDPDVVFFTGDLCNYSTCDALPFQSLLTKVCARYGIYSVMGNHDYGDYKTWPSAEAWQENIRSLERFYDEMGWRLLRNESLPLILEGDTLLIAGVENWGAEKRFQRLADLPKAISGAETISFKLLLSHDPTYWDSIVSKQYPAIDITFSGHTHGGQVGIETGWLNWSPVRYFYPEWAGIYRKRWPDGRDRYLYVNRGAGTIVYAGRIGVWAEISLILLKRSAS